MGGNGGQNPRPVVEIVKSTSVECRMGREKGRGGGRGRRRGGVAMQVTRRSRVAEEITVTEK